MLKIYHSLALPIYITHNAMQPQGDITINFHLIISVYNSEDKELF